MQLHVLSRRSLQNLKDSERYNPLNLLNSGIYTLLRIAKRRNILYVSTAVEFGDVDDFAALPTDEDHQFGQENTRLAGQINAANYPLLKLIARFDD
ncbi:MAG: hypothetical protein ACJA09_000134 [Alcanivorax sp.]|jgi:hypothetical protein